MTGAESPVSEKQERINNVEYNETLKYKTTFLRKPPCCPLNGVRIAALNEAGALAYYLTDQVDSVSTVLDDEGNTLSLMQYLPYGETFVQRGDLNFSPKFNSQELDRESGFYFFNARFYDPGIARFTSADSVIDGEFDTQGWNRFSYVKGNPIGAKDPTGHAPQDENAGFKDASKGIAKSAIDSVKSALSAPTPVNAAVNSAVATAKGAKELYDNRKEVYASAKDFAGKLTSKDDKVRDYAVGQAKAYTMSAVLGGAATKALGSRLPKPNVNVPGSSGASSATNSVKGTISVPEGFVEKQSKKGGGAVFHDPANPHNSIRQMPGNPNSPNPAQQNSYVKFMKDGKFYDANGNVLKSGKLPEAHIPLNKFDITKMPKF